MQDLKNQVVCLSEWVNLLKVDLQKAICRMKKFVKIQFAKNECSKLPIPCMLETY